MDYWEKVPDIDEAFGKTKKSAKRDKKQAGSLRKAEDKAEALSKKNSDKTVFMYSKDGEWIVTLTDPKITGSIKPHRFKNGSQINEAKNFDMKKVKKFLYQAHQKLGEAIFLVDSTANPDIANKIFDLQKQIENLQKIAN